MPIYEYLCAEGHVTERIQLSSTRFDTMPCQTCGGTAAKVQFSVTQWQFGAGRQGSEIGEAIKRVKARGL